MLVCACCVPPVALGILFTALAIVTGSRFVLGWDGRNGMARLLVWTARVIGALLLLVATFLLVLSNDDDLRAKAFSRLMAQMAKASDMDATRCDALGLSGISGHVIELGPGPGSNFRCWGDVNGNPRISSWTGVEPNQYFSQAQKEEADARNATFERTSIWIKGERAQDVPESRYDVAVMTHVLCSVDSPNAVLETAWRALKPGGRIYLLEHVVAPPERWVLRCVQKVVEPILTILADGCHFRDTKTALGLSRFDWESVVPMDAPMPLPLRPHILAKGRKGKR